MCVGIQKDTHTQDNYPHGHYLNSQTNYNTPLGCWAHNTILSTISTESGGDVVWLWDVTYTNSTLSVEIKLH